MRTPSSSFSQYGTSPSDPLGLAETLTHPSNVRVSRDLRHEVHSDLLSRSFNEQQHRNKPETVLQTQNPPPAERRTPPPRREESLKMHGRMLPWTERETGGAGGGLRSMTSSGPDHTLRSTRPHLVRPLSLGCVGEQDPEGGGVREQKLFTAAAERRLLL